MNFFKEVSFHSMMISLQFIAYQELGRIRQLREELLVNQTFHLYLQGNLTLQPGTPMLWDVSEIETVRSISHDFYFQDSSIVILTYALCGKLHCFF